MADFARPWALLLLLAIPAYLWLAWRRTGAAIRFAGAGEDLPGSQRARWLARAPELLRALAFAALVVALAGPYVTATVTERRTEGISIMLAVDVSSSMLAEDFRPRNRLEVAKRVLLRFIAARPEDRIGLVAFAGEALTQVPLTSDHEVLGRAVEGLAAGRLEDGTAMGDGLGTAVARLRRAPAGSRVVVLLSDGDNNRGRVDPRVAAEAAAALGVRVFTVGVGSDGVARVPLGRGPFGLRYGSVRVTLDEALLREMASTTGGSYFRATDAAALARIGERLDRLVRAPVVTRRRGERRDRSLGWVVLGTALLVGEWLLLGDPLGARPVTRLADLALLFGIPALLAGALLLAARRRQRAASALGDPELVRLLWGGGVALPRRRVLLLLLAALALGAALAAARRPAATALGDADVVLALDVSNSMRVADVEPDRLEAERAFAEALVAELAGARVGLVVFAGRGYVLSPLTEDAASLGMYLEALDPEIATQGGSSLAAALRQGVFLLLAADSTERGRSLVIVSDGDALEDDEEVAAAAELARRNGVVVHTLGVGTPRGGPVPDVDPLSGATRGFKREPDGELAISALNADLLRSVARTTGGSYRELRSPRNAAAVAAAALSSGRGRAAGWPLRLLALGVALGLLAADAVLGLGLRSRAPSPPTPLPRGERGEVQSGVRHPV